MPHQLVSAHNAEEEEFDEVTENVNDAVSQRIIEEDAQTSMIRMQSMVGQSMIRFRMPDPEYLRIVE